MAANAKVLTSPPKRILVVYGTRPEAVKLAPVIQLLRDDVRFDPVIAVTGQHREMLAQVNELFNIQPDHDLRIQRHGQTLSEMTSAVMKGVTEILDGVRPDAVLVQGDTTSAFTSALAAFYARAPVIHLEAGLRTDNRLSPFPEEINRRLTSHLASLHFAPTAANKRALIREGIDGSTVIVTGNTVIDALHTVRRANRDFEDTELASLGDVTNPILLVTLHRRESWGRGLTEVAEAVAECARSLPMHVVFPVHKNPVVREQVLPALEGLPNVQIVEPLGYTDFIRVLSMSRLALTDSGGVQEEAPSLGVPVLVARDNTERQEAVTAGTARLVGTSRAVIVKSVTRLLLDDAEHKLMTARGNPYGDGHAARRATEGIAHFLGDGDRPAEFTYRLV